MEVKIEKIDNFGRGITYINDKICFVDNALPNEKVEIEMTDKIEINMKKARTAIANKWNEQKKDGKMDYGSTIIIFLNKLSKMLMKNKKPILLKNYSQIQAREDGGIFKCQFLIY